MPKSILVAFNDSVSSRAAVDYLAGLLHSEEEYFINLVHIFRRPSASEELMGKKFAKEQPARMQKAMEQAKEKFVARGFPPDRIKAEIVSEPYPTVAEGIIHECNKRNVDMVVIGRKRMSKAEEYVMGDICTKLIRALEGTAILVVKGS